MTEITQQEKEEGKKLANAHWAYIEAVLNTHDIDEVEIGRIGFHYRTALEHGFKHGIEYCSEKLEDLTIQQATCHAE